VATPARAAIAAAGLAAAIGLITVSLRRPPPASFEPTPAGERPVGQALAGPIVYTIDASDPSAWRHFSFARTSIVDAPGPLDWDLAFRRFGIIANGGPGFAGRAGILDLGPVDFASVTVVPEAGYQPTRAGRDSANPAIARWYRYGWTTHLLEPKPHVYAVRTADGRYAKLEILGYYCPGARAGCVTIRYVYQGAGGPRLTATEAGRRPRSSRGTVPSAPARRRPPTTEGGRLRSPRRRPLACMPTPAQLNRYRRPSWIR
jgi:hypothetical protein